MFSRKVYSGFYQFLAEAFAGIFIINLCMVDDKFIRSGKYVMHQADFFSFILNKKGTTLAVVFVLYRVAHS